MRFLPRWGLKKNIQQRGFLQSVLPHYASCRAVTHFLRTCELAHLWRIRILQHTKTNKWVQKPIRTSTILMVSLLAYVFLLICCWWSLHANLLVWWTWSCLYLLGSLHDPKWQNQAVGFYTHYILMSLSPFDIVFVIYLQIFLVNPQGFLPLCSRVIYANDPMILNGNIRCYICIYGIYYGMSGQLLPLLHYLGHKKSLTQSATKWGLQPIAKLVNIPQITMDCDTYHYSIHGI